ncbi:hypothetical protein [Pseudoalteromonas luteoviolacea]|uniref:Uncharacterized protein n=1 Tax=Pseudoalteromonas luteoviolacea S4060-1 TaxID=1365257 RepID=A0A167M0B2_9GAMM|nr:hypothetical protein [Pseudoalteromonas luteoviolacea]KZN65607.1 hypothetical protein N478_21145 [Pseudoalteromonas luteoviolacea S4060-1]
MHPIQAQLLGVTPLKLKAQYSTDSAAEQQLTEPVLLSLSERLQQDILLAIHSQELEFVQGELIALVDSTLQLPGAQLDAEQKKQLWRVICNASSK